MVAPKAEQPTRSIWRRPGALAWLLTSVLVPLLLFSAAAAYDHHAIMSRAQERVQSTAEGLAENAHIVLETAALTLSLQLNAVQGMSWQEIGSSQAVHDFLAGLTHQLPQLERVFFVDPTGHSSAGSAKFPVVPTDVQNRDYYQAAVHNQHGLHVSAPFKGKLDGSMGVVVSQARVVNGHSDGVAAVTLSPAYFRSFYHMILGRHEDATAALIREDGTLLFHYPAGSHIPARLPADARILKLLHAGKTTGLFESGLMPGRDPKLVAYRKVQGQDLVAIYGLDYHSILSEWYRHLAIFAAFALVAAGALLLAGFRAIQQAERDERHLRALLSETERRQLAEAALQQSAKMEALGRLTGGVAHDFNNLLAAVLGSLELAGRRSDDPQIRRVLGVAEQAARRGAKLTAQMLAFARKRAIEPQPVAVNQLARSADELLRRTAGSMVKLDFDLDESLGCVMADPVQLELALLNLVANARDALPEGGSVTIATARARPAEIDAQGLPAAPHVVLTVADTGSGMPEDVRVRVFEPFYTTKPPGSGTGLGLSMVYGFARQMGGTATIDSAPERGTKVRLWLPETTLRPPREDEQAAVPPGTERRLRVLLVDDDPMVRDSALEMLGELGHQVATAADGQQALAMLREDADFDVMLADFAMPGMNGSELAEAALRLHPGLPVAFISGYVADDALRGWSTRGFRTLMKPFRLADLASVLRGVGKRPIPAPASE